MNAAKDNQAPWPRPQKEAALGFPPTLVIGLAAMAAALAGPVDFPSWAVALILVAAIIAGLAITIIPRRSEPLDERDRLIMLKAAKRAFGFLSAGLVIPFGISLVFVPGPPRWDVEQLGVALVILAQAVYFGSILLLYRRGAED